MIHTYTDINAHKHSIKPNTFHQCYSCCVHVSLACGHFSTKKRTHLKRSEKLRQLLSLSGPRDNDITGVLDHTFCVEHSAYGELIQHELKPNGKNVAVTQDTKKEYVRLYVNWRFLRGIEAQFLALQKGFSEVIPQHLLKAFDEKELEVSRTVPLPLEGREPCFFAIVPREGGR